MSWQRKYDFKNGTYADAEQIDTELNQLISAINTLESTDNTNKSLAQMKKITNDAGAPKLSISDKTKNLLTELSNLGVGLHSFYAIDGTVNLPNGKSSRGLFHQTSDGFGWAFAYDYSNAMYFNYLDNGVWKGWKTLATADVAQMTKITTDTGGTKLNATKTTDDILALISGAGVGLHSFYAIANCLNAPSVEYSVRGFAFMTSSSNGVVWAIDTNGTIYTMPIVNNAALSWVSYGITQQEELWSGVKVMTGADRIFPSKKLSECKNGWILLWSDYDADTKKANDYDFVYSYIPKYHAQMFEGKGVFSPTPNYLSSTSVETTTKRLYIYDSNILGADENNAPAPDTNDICLRAVIEW